jgi:hypothetical protein
VCIRESVWVGIGAYVYIISYATPCVPSRLLPQYRGLSRQCLGEQLGLGQLLGLRGVLVLLLRALWYAVHPTSSLLGSEEERRNEEKGGRQERRSG